MWFLTSHAIAGLVLTTLVSVSAATLDTKQAPPGTLSCVIGEAWIGSQPLNEKSAGSAALSEGQLLRTGDGTVEVILAADVYMRVAKDSSVRIVSLKPINVGVEVRQGQAMVEVGARRNPVTIRGLEHDATAQQILLLGEDLKRGIRSITEVVIFDEEELTEETLQSCVADITDRIDELQKHYRRANQLAGRLPTIVAKQKAREYPPCRFSLAREIVRISLIVCDIPSRKTWSPRETSECYFRRSEPFVFPALSNAG